MWANAAVPVASAVAIRAEHLEPLGEVVLPEPPICGRPGLAPVAAGLGRHPPAMLSSIAINVVDRQEHDLGLATACALAAVMFDDLALQLPVRLLVVLAVLVRVALAPGGIVFALVAGMLVVEVSLLRPLPGEQGLPVGLRVRLIGYGHGSRPPGPFLRSELAGGGVERVAVGRFALAFL